MSLSDDLDRLADLHRRGVLTDDEFARAKARTLDAAGGAPGAPSSASHPSGGGAVDTLNGLRRSLTDRWLGGVCGGIAKSLGLASWVVRLIFVLMVLCAGTGLLLYVLLWIFVPEETLPMGYGSTPPRGA